MKLLKHWGVISMIDHLQSLEPFSKQTQDYEMTTPDTQSTVTADPDFTKTWRYKVGFAMIVVGNLGILIAMVLPALGVRAGTVGAMVVGGEIVSLASIAFLGKAGFKAIKSKFFAFIKASYTGPVGRTRHTIGITLLCYSMVTSYIIALYLWDAFSASTAATVPPEVWKLNFEQQDTLMIVLFFSGEASFLISICVLGANWWDKFRSLFVWEKPADQG